MECHKCKWNGKRSRHCIDCAAASPDIPQNNHGRASVSLDGIEGTRYEPRAMPPTPGGEPEPPPIHGPGGVFISPAAADLLCAFLRKMASFTQREFRVLVLRMEAATSVDGRPTLAQIGAELGVTKQNVKYMLGNIAAKCPELLALFPGMRQTLRPEQRRRADAKQPPRQSFLPLEYSKPEGSKE